MARILATCRQQARTLLDCGGFCPWCGGPATNWPGSRVTLRVRGVEGRKAVGRVESHPVGGAPGAVPGLARALISDTQYEVSRKAYQREPYDPAEVPSDLRKLIRPEYFDPQFFAASAYGRLAAETTAYRWIIKSPVRNYYGESDEVISVGLGQLAMNYQRSIGAGNRSIDAISTGSTTHRGTFATAVPSWKSWFDGL